MNETTCITWGVEGIGWGFLVALIVWGSVLSLLGYARNRRGGEA